MQRMDLRDGGMLLYDPAFYPPELADQVFRRLRDETPWAQEISRGKPFPRLTAWYADPGISYSYSGVTHQPLPWTELLARLRADAQRAAGAEFNGLLLNRYRDGRDSMGFHSDDEPELGRNPVIASISLGAVRRFVLRHRQSSERLTLELAHGSLLVMGGTCQHHWQHAVPKTTQPLGERINLTFRKLLPLEQAVGSAGFLPSPERGATGRG